MGASQTIATGTLIGDRFEVEAEIGAGGMGAVYRARDRKSDELVAVKVLAGAASADRFVREARLLAELSHPAIVRYLAHGASPVGPFLAMEWLEGEDLSARLGREALSLDETLDVIRRTAEALAVAHRAGVIHRDIKPSNLFLQGGDPARLKVLDFGVARSLAATRAMTRTGMMVGTVGYMAPEQARGRKDIDARVDLFALGCVFYECVTGRPAFEGNNPMAVLAQLMLEEPPRISDVRPDVSSAVDELVGRMMAKDREARPANVEAVVVGLESLGNPSAPAPEARRAAVAMTGSEQRLLNVLLMARHDSAPDATLTPEQEQREAQAVQAVVEPFGGETTRLGLGPFLVVLKGRGNATDAAARAASCALALRDAFPDARVALATGRAGTDAGMPLGPGVESAAELLTGARSGTVRIDSVTASLLDPRFEIAGGELRAEGESASGVRKLLGKPTRCVGRRKELRLLRDMLDESAEEGFAQTALVTAPAGTGKSRLRHELLAGVDREEWTVLEARATPVGAGAPLLLARQLVRRGLGEDVTDFATLLERVAALPLEEPARVAEFLGETIGAPSEREPSPQLQVGRNDERLMAEWTGRSIAEWLGALAARGPLLIVLEDLHWGDAATVAHIDRALRDYPDAPWLVLALARPEVDEVFPKLWSSIELQRLELTGLHARAAGQLVRDLLPDTTDATVEEIVARADGNAFFLEELIRHASEGGGALPETVLAMTESRLLKLGQEPRRILQAASVLGERFEAAAVGALVGEANAAEWLDQLVDRELLEPDREREGRLVFRHGLLRDAAYAMLAPDDRKVAHGIAADWLASHGDPEPLVMIDHLERADRPGEAPPWYLAASKAGYAGGAMDLSARLATDGLAAGAAGTLRGQLLYYLGAACTWTDDLERGLALFTQAIPLLPEGSVDWLAAVSGKVFGAIFSDRADLALGEIAAMAQLAELPAHDSRTGHAVYIVHTALIMAGQIATARTFLSRIEDGHGYPQADASFRGFIHLCHQAELNLIAGDSVAALAQTSTSRELGQQVADPLLLATAEFIWAVMLMTVGAHAEATALIESAAVDGLPTITRYMKRYCYPSHLELGALDTVREFADDLEGADPGTQLIHQTIRTEVALAAGDRPPIEALAKALAAAGPLTLHEELAHAADALARAHLVNGSPEPAMAMAKRGLTLIDKGGVMSSTRTSLLQVHADALLANGLVDEARTAIRDARDRLLQIHQSLPEPYKSGYLNGNRSHRRTMELAEELLGEAGDEDGPGGLT